MMIIRWFLEIDDVMTAVLEEVNGEVGEDDYVVVFSRYERYGNYYWEISVSKASEGESFRTTLKVVFEPEDSEKDGSLETRIRVLTNNLYKETFGSMERSLPSHDLPDFVLDLDISMSNRLLVLNKLKGQLKILWDQLATLHKMVNEGSL